jgi:hypothetical protein
MLNRTPRTKGITSGIVVMVIVWQSISSAAAIVSHTIATTV